MQMQMYVHVYVHMCAAMHILIYLMTNLYMISKAKAKSPYSIQIKLP